MNETIEISYIYGDDEESSRVMNEIKSHGLDHVKPVKIQMIEVGDVRTQQWLLHNNNQIFVTDLPCFLVVDDDETYVIPIENKQDVYDYVINTYI